MHGLVDLDSMKMNKFTNKCSLKLILDKAADMVVVQNGTPSYQFPIRLAKSF